MQAGLDPKTMDNNIAFNVKLTPRTGESRRDIVAVMQAYVTAYFNPIG